MKMIEKVMKMEKTTNFTKLNTELKKIGVSIVHYVWIPNFILYISSRIKIHILILIKVYFLYRILSVL